MRSVASRSWGPQSQRAEPMTSLVRHSECRRTSGVAATYQIGQLEKAGLVRRRSCPSDERAVYAVLTDDGMGLLERAAPGHVAMVRELLIDVLTPDQVRALADGLGEASRRMTTGPVCSGPDAEAAADLGG